jgi:hypothetical protein
VELNETYLLSFFQFDGHVGPWLPDLGSFQWTTSSADCAEGLGKRNGLIKDFFFIRLCDEVSDFTCLFHDTVQLQD